MDKDPSNGRLKAFSDIIVEELKGLAAAGKQLTAEFLASRLSSRSEITELMDMAAHGNAFETTESSETAVDIKKLNAKLEKAQIQKNRLLKQLTELEEKEVHLSGFYQHTLLMFVELLRTEENKSIHKSLDTLKQILKNSANIDDLKAPIRRLKDMTLQEDAPRDPKQTNLVNRWFNRFAKEGTSQEETLDQLKKTYAEIVEEFKLNLDKTSFKRLKDLEDQIQQMDRLEDFSHVRNEIVSLLQEYVSRIGGEREEAAAFIREIGERLLEVENHILAPLPFTQEGHRDNTEFTTLLEKQIGKLRQDVDFSESLSKLKRTVGTSLSTIQKAIEQKRDTDSARMVEMNKQMERLQSNLHQMKNEISVAKDRAQTLEHEVLTDPLTGVYNRRAYEKRLREELQRFLRHKHSFSVLLLDVDHFKSINDRYGHAVGDLCLKEIIKRVRPLLRKSDFLARFGGEEFVTLLPETGQEGAVEVAEKLRQCIEKTDFLHRGESVGVTISIGVTQAESTDLKPDSLFIRVDKALYQAKEEGRNRIAVR